MTFNSTAKPMILTLLVTGVLTVAVGNLEAVRSGAGIVSGVSTVNLKAAGKATKVTRQAKLGGENYGVSN